MKAIVYIGRIQINISNNSKQYVINPSSNPFHIAEDIMHHPFVHVIVYEVL